MRRVEPGDTVGGQPIRIEPAIEVGNIFKLGTRYSEKLNATYLDESGTARHIWMGSYGIGPARVAAAAVEQFADEQGISWPRSVAPFDVHLVGLGRPGSDERELAESLYEELRADRARRPLRRPRRRPGREVRRRRAARLPRAADGRAAHTRERRGRGPGPPGTGEPGRSRSRAPRRRWPICGEASRRRRARDGPARRRPGGRRARPSHVPPSLGPRPVGPAASADARRPAAAPVDDPEHDRVRPPGADPGLPLPLLHLRGRLERGRRGRVRGDRRGATTSTASAHA